MSILNFSSFVTFIMELDIFSLDWENWFGESRVLQAPASETKQIEVFLS